MKRWLTLSVSATLLMLAACSPKTELPSQEGAKTSVREEKSKEVEKEKNPNEGKKKDPYQMTQKELSGEHEFSEERLRAVNEERKKEGLEEWESGEEIALEVLNKERKSRGEKEFQTFQELYDFSPAVKEEKLTLEEFKDYIFMFVSELFMREPPRIEPSMEKIMIQAVLDNDPSPSTIVDAVNQWWKDQGEAKDYPNLRAIYESKPHEGFSFGSILAHNQISWCLEHGK